MKVSRRNTDTVNYSTVMQVIKQQFFQNMDWKSNSFEPNLEFALELKEDLKTKYYKQHEEAKKALEEFSISLKNIFYEHQKLLIEKLELSIANEKLQQIVNKRDTSKEEFKFDSKPYSEILGASPNCRLEVTSKSSSLLIKSHSKLLENGLMSDKENIDEIMQINTEDFLSDMEEEISEKHKSPPTSLAGTPAKVQASPILSKRKRGNNSKKSNSSLSNTSSHSIASSNDDKSNASQYATCGTRVEVIEIEKDLEKEFEEEIKEPLKAVENTFQPEPKISNLNKNYKLLDFSRTSYGNTHFAEKGKKLRQTKLTLRKPTPVIDISKVDLDESYGGKSNKSQINNSWSDTFFDNNSISQNKNLKTQLSYKNNSKEKLNISKDDELIDSSFAANKNTSKLRKKLTLGKRSGYNKYEKRDKSPDMPQRSLSDETYFTQAETATNKNKKHEIDLTEDDISVTPPAKRKLLNSFDVIPGRTQESPEYAYKEPVVRKKSERAQLNGWDCKECEKWYCGMTDEERKTRVNKCSRHRGKYRPEVSTPESFWDPDFKDTDDSFVFDNK